MGRSTYFKFKFIPSRKVSLLSPSALVYLVITQIVRHNCSALAMDVPSAFSTPGQSVTNNRGDVWPRSRGAHKRAAESWCSPHLAYPEQIQILSRRSLGQTAHHLVGRGGPCQVCVSVTAFCVKDKSLQ